MRTIGKARSKEEIIARICDQVSNLRDIRLLLMRSTEPPKSLRKTIIDAINNYTESDGKPIVGDKAPQLADQIISSRKFDLNNVLVRANKDKPLKPWRKGFMPSGEFADVREVTKEDRLADLRPTYDTPAPNETASLDPDEKA